MRLDFLNVRMQVDDQTLISNNPMEILKPVPDYPQSSGLFLPNDSLKL
jgi:hypothetical protein